MPMSNISVIRSKKRASYISLSSTTSSVSMSNNVDILASRTPNAITKSNRHSSAVMGHVQDLLVNEPSSDGMSRGYNNNLQQWPPLLSDSTNSYYQDLASLDNCELIRPETPTLKARASVDSIYGNDTNTFCYRSSSISSILGPANMLPSLDVHALYKTRITRSSKKLDKFFGEYAPHDICIKEIRREGLKAILESKVPLCWFLYHLLREHSSENLFFFIELEQYESFTYSSLEQQLATAQHIYNTYLTKNSYFEVNLDDKARTTVTSSLEEKKAKHCFDAAKRAVYSLLESSYRQFKNSDIFNDMVRECGELNTHFDDATKITATKKLVFYISEKCGKESSTTTGEPKETLQNNQMKYNLIRYKLISSMISEFCRTLVGVETDHNSMSAESNFVQREKEQQYFTKSRQFTTFNNNSNVNGKN